MVTKEELGETDCMMHAVIERRSRLHETLSAARAQPRAGVLGETEESAHDVG